MMGVYTLVFSVLWKAARRHPALPAVRARRASPSGGSSRPAVQLGHGSLVANGELIKKVWFPRELVPAAAVLAQTVSIVVMLAILIPST